ncbi:hypothetical protein GCM10022268_06520 [Sphingomonas cynarae]|uniref:O-antigen ligase-related domain-containing protein n=1 Tax=Sphingomonas cynarae TaxID=930197 RepID=A0ABP7D019_9SPHN
MIYLAKIGFIIVALTTLAVFLLGKLLKKPFRKFDKIAILATAIPLAIFCVSQIWLAFAGIASTVAYYGRRRINAPGIAIFLIITLPGISITLMIGSLQLITFSVATAVILGLLIASLSWKGSFNRRKHTNDITIFVIVTVIVFIFARNTSVTNSIRHITESMIAYLLPYFLVRNSLRDAASVKNMTMFIIVAAVAVSAIAIFESFLVWPVYQGYGTSFGTLMNANVKMRGGLLRASGPSMNPPLSSAVLALCFVVTFASSSLFKTKTGHRLATGIVAMGLFAMQARVGWLGAIIGSIAIIISKRGTKAFAGYIPAVAIVIALIFGYAQIDDKFAGIVGFSSDAKGSVEYRDQMSDLGIEIVKSHPLIGQPIPVVAEQMAAFKQGEGIVDFVNGYLSIALFSGLIGLFLFISSLLIQGINTFSGRRLAASRGAGSLAHLGIGVVATAISIFPFIPTDYRVILIMFLLFALSNAIVTHYHENPIVNS